MTPATKSKPEVKADALTELAKLEAALEAAEQRQAEFDAELVENREILDGPLYDRNTPGAVQKLQDLLQRDPTQFKSDGTPTGPDAKRLQAAIDQVGDLGPLAQQAEHARRLTGKAQLDRDAFIRAQGPALEAARRPEGERLRANYEKAARVLLDAAERLQAFGQRSILLAGICGIDTRRVPFDEVSNAVHTIRGLAETPPLVELAAPPPVLLLERDDEEDE